MVELQKSVRTWVEEQVGVCGASSVLGRHILQECR
jgi:hypothetical protein